MGRFYRIYTNFRCDRGSVRVGHGGLDSVDLAHKARDRVKATYESVLVVARRDSQIKLSMFNAQPL